MYNKIYDFCKIRNSGGVYQNTNQPTPRVSFILNLLKSEGIEYELDAFPLFVGEDEESDPKGFNIILKGTSNRMVIAHHDVANPKIDNANDNSASVINAIMIKKLRPDINVVINDGEEVGGLGSQRISNRIKAGDFGKIDWVLNLELTGSGGKYFFIGDYPGKLTNHIKSLFDCPIVSTPYNDTVTIRKNNIDSVVINSLPILSEGKKSNIKYDNNYLDYSMLFNCHSNRDSIDTINPKDMKEFTEEVILKILDS